MSVHMDVSLHTCAVFLFLWCDYDFVEISMFLKSLPAGWTPELSLHWILTLSLHMHRQTTPPLVSHLISAPLVRFFSSQFLSGVISNFHFKYGPWHQFSIKSKEMPHSCVSIILLTLLHPRTSFHLFLSSQPLHAFGAPWGAASSLTSVHWWQAGNDKWMMVVFTSASSMSVTVMIYNIPNISNNNLLHPHPEGCSFSFK